MPLAAGARFGAHEIVAFLGAGGMGEVWRARDTRLDREVALKVLPPATLDDETARARLLREARLASKLNHPHVCTIHEVGEAEGRTFVAMELVEGHSLSALVSRGALPTEQVLCLGQQLADALAHAHEHGVVHRDFKSANVFITPEGRAKVLDFGLAKRLAGEGASEATTASYGSLTAPGALAGTLAYMAPEQLRGQAADARSDIWALGVVLYEMVSGRRPFQGQTGFALSSAILNEAPPVLPAGVPDGLRGVIERCLEKEPAQRHQRAAEVRAALEAIQCGAALPSRGAPRRTASRRLWLGAVAVLATAVAVLLTLDAGSLRRRLAPGLGRSARAVKLAVLPFANLSGDPEQEYLSDGLTQEMIAQLGRLHPQSLSVIARTSVMRYKKTETPVDRIGRELGVDYVLEGSAQREGGRVRISAELIQVRGQTQLWADVYERELAGILALQSEVARKVAGALALKLLPAEEARLARVRAVDPEAHEAYLKGLQHFYRVTPGDLESALLYFELAVEKDPDDALAQAGISLVWTGRNQLQIVPRSEAVPKAKAAALRAVALDDSLAEAHWALAAVMAWHEWDWAGAEPEFTRAIELNPSYPDVRAFYSHFLHIMGRPEEAMPQIERAVELDPLNALFQAFYAQDLVWVGRYDDGIAQARKVLQTAPDNHFAKSALWMAYELQGADAEALALARADNAEDPELLKAIERGSAEGGYRQAMRRAAELLETRARTTRVRALDIASCYDSAGDKQRALDWLEKALQERDPGLPYIVLRNWRNSVGDDPRSRALRRGLNLPPPS